MTPGSKLPPIVRPLEESCPVLAIDAAIVRFAGHDVRTTLSKRYGATLDQSRTPFAASIASKTRPINVRVTGSPSPRSL